MAEVAVLLRDGTHSAASIKYGLKADSFAISVVKTPIQIPIPRHSPELIDIGIFRPSITISGLVDNIGGNTSNTTANVQGMSSFVYSRNGISSTYYIPYKNRLEDVAYRWLARESSKLEIEIGNANYPVFNITGDGGAVSGTNHATGGAIYQVAIQQMRFEVQAGKEDRWQYTMQFVARARTGVSFA